MRVGSRVFVAGGTRAVRCAQPASDVSYVIRVALFADPIFRDWVLRGDIRRVASVKGLSTLLNAHVVDWIFSLCNPFALAADVLGRVRQGAFKCREGPLARCAGSAATSSALLVQDAEYAVAWHRIDGGADTGDRVVQPHVLIAPTDTASALNLKWCEFGVEAFRERLTVLAWKLSACPQALIHRGEFPERRRPMRRAACDGIDPRKISQRQRPPRTLGRIIPIVLYLKAVVALGAWRCCLTAWAYRRALSLSP